MYFWFATGFSNISHMNNVNLTPVDVPMLCGLIASVVQIFFAHRIYTLRRGYWVICCLIALTSLVQLGGAIGNGSRSFKIQKFSEFHQNIVFPQSMHVWLVGDVVCDVLIAGTMLKLFFASRKKTTAQGNRILKQVVRLIVETNTLTGQSDIYMHGSVNHKANDATYYVDSGFATASSDSYNLSIEPFSGEKV
ncbi:hypothetical protein D9619_009421 [Psilocybe cf. subviscida]|uniref:Uncharacterized protein n=1 Tax=Psilocybe cf. subviscida TaxID=2480587 RepID=A0A8H5FAU2_9AGAR|nr:hypothetical protein D9619_009421 [Psilocybe cf. subviscida]